MCKHACKVKVSAKHKRHTKQMATDLMYAERANFKIHTNKNTQEWSNLWKHCSVNSQALHYEHCSCPSKRFRLPDTNGSGTNMYRHIYTYIHTYIQAWICKQVKYKYSWAEQFKRTKVKLAFTDCTRLDQMCMLRSFIFEWWGCRAVANWNVSKRQL